VQGLLNISKWIDWLNDNIGKLAYWLTLVVVLVSSGNALVRYLADTPLNNLFQLKTSNAWLELQWYLFSAIFLLCGGYALLHNAHVRIDVIYGRWSRRTQLWIDVLGTLFFLLPMAILILYLSWPVFMNAYMNKEVSSNAGGLIVWPARLLLPIGFFLLVLQGFSELIKRCAILQGLTPDPALADSGPTAEEELAQAIQEAREKVLADGKVAI
jgi:TRAP-type mannitol/chloroaromatic compound transport system permease small subunit